MIRAYVFDLSARLAAAPAPDAGRVRSEAARGLLAAALSAEGIRLTGDEVWKTDRFGKPHLEGLPGVTFSLSHSGHYAACALGQTPVGVDVQMTGSVREAVVRRQFSAQEARAIAASPDPERMFARIWTGREAYLKKLGCGLRRPLSSFRVDPENGRIEDDEEETARTALAWFSAGPEPGDAVLAVCGEEDGFAAPVFLNPDDPELSLANRRNGSIMKLLTGKSKLNESSSLNSESVGANKKGG